MKRKLKVSSAIAGIMAMTVMLAACGGTNEQPGIAQSETPKADDKPTEISIMTMFYSPEPPDENNGVLKEIEKRTNTKLKVSWNSPNNYSEKMNVTLASGDVPDLMLVSDPFVPVVRKAAAQGAFWDLTPHYNNYPTLAAFPKESWEYTKMEDAKNYGVPRVRPTDGGGFPYIRKDWLDQLGLQVPQTMDDLHNVWKAFVEKDPDGNGKQDTIGYSGYLGQNDMASYSWIESVFNNSHGDWKLANGKLVNSSLLSGTRDALVYLNNAYKEKLIPEDIAILKDSQSKDMVKSGKSGMYADTLEGAWVPLQELRKTNPKADILPLVSLNGFTQKDPGFFGMYVISKNVSEEKLKKILQFLDYGASADAWDLVSYGLKDVHYNEKDGNKTLTELGTKELVTQGAFKQLFYKDDKYQRAYRNGMPNDYLERNKKIIDERAKISQPDISVGLFSETYLNIGTELKKKTQDLKTKVIMGKEPIEAWDDYVKKLQADPDMLKMTKEFNDSYQKRVSGAK
jgi:putative aldouronate transport system substrate-binding protein